LFYSDDKGIGKHKGGIYYGKFVDATPSGGGKYMEAPTILENSET
jgi:hypothetical protein